MSLSRGDFRGLQPLDVMIWPGISWTGHTSSVEFVGVAAATMIDSSIHGDDGAGTMQLSLLAEALFLAFDDGRKETSTMLFSRQRTPGKEPLLVGKTQLILVLDFHRSLFEVQ